MKPSIKIFFIKVIFVIPLLLISTTYISAQSINAYENTKNEIQQQFGTFPEMFEVFPEYALPGAWETFKQLKGPNSKIPGKYRELLQLAVASQIPCAYCIYFHSASAKAFGATDAEVREAIAHGAETRHWSMVLQGNQIDFVDFKIEFDAMMQYMSEQSNE